MKIPIHELYYQIVRIAERIINNPMDATTIPITHKTFTDVFVVISPFCLIANPSIPKIIATIASHQNTNHESIASTVESIPNTIFTKITSKLNLINLAICFVICCCMLSNSL